MKEYGSQSMIAPLRKVLVKRPDGAFAGADPARWHYTARPDLDAARREHDAFVRILGDAGAEVFYHDEPQPERADAIYVYDPAIVTDRGAIVLRMGKDLRRGEEGPASSRQPYRELLDLFISDLTSQLGADEAYHEGQRRHIAITPVNSTASVARDPHLAARGYFVELDHPGAGRLHYPGAPYRHTETPWALHGPAPAVGQHNREIYGGELGLAAESLQALERDEII